MLSVVNNIGAMNASRQYGTVSKSQSKSVEKLSSGYKINRAADDAAGLTISEKMRSLVRGLTQASENCQDGVSVCQIGDGALAEVHDMLHRCTELSVKSANGTNTDADRRAMQSEIDQILDEIDSIAQKTEFNTLPLLLGEGKATTTKVVPGTGLPGFVALVPSGNRMIAPNSDTNLNGEISALQGSSGIASGTVQAAALVDFSNVDATNIEQLAGTGFHFTCCTCDHYYSISFNNENSTKSETNGDTTVIDVPINGITDGKGLVNKILSVAGGNPNNHYTNLVASIDGDKLVLYDNRLDPSSQRINPSNAEFAPGVTKSIKVVEGIADIVIQAGAAGTEENRIKIPLPNISTANLEIDSINVSTQQGARNAIAQIDYANAYVSDKRSMFGAFQNRFEHTIANLDNVVENVTDAESRIRDVDMAKELVNSSKNNILLQAGTAMMSQANQSTQSVLALLQ